MPVLAVYQQTFTAATLATYAWSFQLRRVMKTKQSSRFVVKINTITVSQASIAPAVSNNQLLVYMSSPELCANADTQTLTPTGTVINNKIPISYSAQPYLNFVCNDYPVNPILFNAEFTSTQLAPTAGNIVFTVSFRIFEIDGDIPDALIV